MSPSLVALATRSAQTLTPALPLALNPLLFPLRLPRPRRIPDPKPWADPYIRQVGTTDVPIFFTYIRPKRGRSNFDRIS